ncbi:MAG: CAP domain-containing protein [Bradymonadaceae bacterium]
MPKLTMNAKLREAARCHSLDMARNDFFSHTSSNGSSPGDRMTKAGYNWTTWGENIAKGYPTPKDVVSGWMNSTPHCENIMSSDFVDTGVGYVYDSKDSKPYWTETFAK